MTDHTTTQATGPLVEITGLRKAFGGTTVLRDIDFTVPKGSVTVLLGPSGSGKTTVLRSLNVLDLPDAGVVRIGDASVDFSTVTRGRDGRARGESAKSVAALRRQSGMVFQQHNLFPHKSALENVIEGPVVVQGEPVREAEERGRELLAKVGLADQADKYPYQLSGGQQQRVGIARALALRPELLLFDEPTSALDPELVGGVLSVMRELADEGRTMFVVTHEIRFARDVADQVLFMDGGVVVELGTPAEVIDAPRMERTQTFLKRILDPLS
ncbi:amino acid ABC transporter ATP-binding protein [Dermacoccus sp. Tok2021]|uniref:amino acid ABC transporter ATP-binding protein n=1 Tax=Dermacoccus sp. Tok2021 TaxID=2826873 RepID=UPI001CA74491|nr:amino acid ABC transporter ATP-binding protein [Dermacoccus sp. Tok2021]MBZ4497186.1 amino acid ABC transporter ATP-binding protein [Dermacoccus sp. Tok2021]